jgi:hypothetical protein
VQAEILELLLEFSLLVDVHIDLEVFENKSVHIIQQEVI